MATDRPRYQVTFTPVGWQVIDIVEARDPMAEFGTGSDEYRRATQEADRLNGKKRTDGAAVYCPTCGAQFGGMTLCPWDGSTLCPIPDADPTAVAFYEAIKE